MRIVVALGGNAIAPRGESHEAGNQVSHVERAAAAIAELVREGHEVVVTHGNGPQVGLLAKQSTGLSLDVLGAETEGMIGYWIDRELANQLPDHDVAALLTQVEVDAEDTAFKNPTKPIGAVVSKFEAKTVTGVTHGWQYVAEGSGYRRVVASPEPRAILELNTIRLLVETGVIVVCGGGGGIPVVRDSAGRLHGCEAVIDKDRFAALLADQLEAEFLLLLTDVPAVYEDWPDPAERPIRQATVSALEKRVFEAGSMGPKIEAACRFTRRPDRKTGIGALDEAAAIVRGESGTLVLFG